MALKWFGKRMSKRVESAAIAAVDATMSTAILHAKANHGKAGGGLSREAATAKISGQRFVTRSSELERSVRIVNPGKRSGSDVVGTWGSIGVVYARRIELGFQGKDKRGAVVNAPAYPFLQPAADAEYPKLTKRIARAYRRGL